MIMIRSFLGYDSVGGKLSSDRFRKAKLNFWISNIHSKTKQNSMNLDDLQYAIYSQWVRK